MHEVEIWFDVVSRSEGELETVCTIFGVISLPMRPLVGEDIRFHHDNSSLFEFHRCEPNRGIVKVNLVEVEVDYISHYGVRSSDGLPIFRTHVRCVDIEVPSLNDARVIRFLMESQFALGLDPYAINKLDGSIAN